MYDIICDIWRNPGAAYSAMPLWKWDGERDGEILSKQLDSYHKKGIDAVLVSGADRDGLNDAYFALVREVLEAAKKRRMLVAFTELGGDGAYHPMRDVTALDRRYGARKLYAVPMDQSVDGEILLCFFVKREEGLLVEVCLEEKEGYEGYYLCLGYTEGRVSAENASPMADMLNPATAERMIELAYEPYYKELKEYFGSTIIGFCPSLTEAAGYGASMDGGILWSYGMTDEFFECGGELEQLAALLFPPKEKKIAREGEYVYRKAMEKSLRASYYDILGKWCRDHGVALMGCGVQGFETALTDCFDMPLTYRSVNRVDEKGRASESAILVKAAADSARHRGIPHSGAVCFGDLPEMDRTPDGMMAQVNGCFADGASKILPGVFLETAGEGDVGESQVLWKDYKPFAQYMKRMSWLNGTGFNDPEAAVLCTPEYVPSQPIPALWENGVSFNYLTTDDLMERAHVHDGCICIDRYHYHTILVDSRLRLNADIVTKIGKMVTEGGDLYRGSDFIGHMKKHRKVTSWFEGETGGKLRFVRLQKSGCPFFLLVNEGETDIAGALVTDLNGAADLFDPFTGKIYPMTAEMHESGFAYPVTVPSHAVKVIGMNPDGMVRLGVNPKQKTVELTALTEGRMTFSYTPSEHRHARLCFTELHHTADVTVNGTEAGRLVFKPYSLDITHLLTEGENTVGVHLSAQDGDGSFRGCTLRILEDIE